MARKPRTHFTAEEKVRILRRHLVDREHVSVICKELGLAPTVFYRWQKQFFENGAAAFASSSPKLPTAPLEQKISLLEQKLARKHEVLSELMEEHILLKKELGEP